MRSHNLHKTFYGSTASRTRERTSVLKQLASAALLLIASAAVSTAQQTPSSPQVTVIRAGKLVDVDSGRMLTNQMLVVREGKIEALGENLSVPAGATVIDLSRMTVLPGLIDCHTHLADLGDAEPLLVLQKSAAESAYAAIPNARVTLLAGFTTVRDVGVYRAFNDVALRNAIACTASGDGLRFRVLNVGWAIDSVIHPTMKSRGPVGGHV